MTQWERSGGRARRRAARRLVVAAVAALLAPASALSSNAAASGAAVPAPAAGPRPAAVPHLSSVRTFVVNTTADADATHPASGNCSDANGQCSLRAAIEVANALDEGVTIRLGPQTYDLTLGSLVLTDPAGISIVGVSSSKTTIRQSASGRVMEVEEQQTAVGSGSTAGALGAVRDVTIAKGTAPTTGSFANQGGAVLLADANDDLVLSNDVVTGSSASSEGGGIYANGQLWLSHASLRANQAGGSGGGIYENNGALAIDSSSFSANTIDDPGKQADGGAVYTTGGTAVISRSSFSSNTVTGVPAGGALFVDSTAQ
ncbi:MAG TPA: CSLREA domain-containing protein, partial [Acidimicrobiales bacterium]|nr:CSLREA domain-containing protein [Acidimicrobiales bacterium]